MIRVLSSLAAVFVPAFALGADLPSRAEAPAPLAPEVAAPIWTGFYIGASAGYLKNNNSNRIEYTATEPNQLSFNRVQRNVVFGNAAIRALSTPTLGSLSGLFPLFATADSPVYYYNTSTTVSGGAAPTASNNTAQINSRTAAANQAALDQAVANGALPSSLIGGQRDLFTGGLALGYNHQFSSVVLGIEADFSYLGRTPEVAFAAGAPVVVGVNPLVISLGGGDYITSNALIAGEGNNEPRWLATLRGRFGFAVHHAFVYATGGLAAGRVKSSASISINDSFLSIPTVDAVWSGSYSKTRIGWTLGLGAEYALTENWSLKAEYLHYDLGRHSYELNSVNPDSALPYDSGDYAVAIRARARTQGDIVRAGVNYRF